MALLRLPSLVFDDTMLKMDVRDADFEAGTCIVAVDAVAGAEHTQVCVAQNVDLLCELYAERGPPQQSARHARDKHGEVFNFFPGRFLDRIRPNWLGFKTRDAASTKLPAKYKRKIERLPWFACWKKDIAKRSGVKAKVKQKVSLCALCTRAWTRRGNGAGVVPPARQSSTAASSGHKSGTTF